MTEEILLTKRSKALRKRKYSCFSLKALWICSNSSIKGFAVLARSGALRAGNLFFWLHFFIISKIISFAFGKTTGVTGINSILSIGNNPVTSLPDFFMSITCFNVKLLPILLSKNISIFSNSRINCLDMYLGWISSLCNTRFGTSNKKAATLLNPLSILLLFSSLGVFPNMSINVWNIRVKKSI